MTFEIFPVAYASIGTLMNSINKVIINPLIVLVFAVALVYFVYGVMQFVLNGANEEARKLGKSHMLWGLIGIFIMVAVFGIMRLIMNTLGVNNIKVPDSGTITITK